MRRRKAAFVLALALVIASMFQLAASDADSVGIPVRGGTLTINLMEDSATAAYPVEVPNDIFSRAFTRVLKDLFQTPMDLDISFPSEGEAFVKYPTALDKNSIPVVLDSMEKQVGKYIDELLELQAQDVVQTENLAMDKVIGEEPEKVPEVQDATPEAPTIDEQTKTEEPQIEEESSESEEEKKPLRDGLIKARDNDSFTSFNPSDHGINIGLVTGLRLDQNGVFNFWFGPSVNWKSNSIAIKYQTNEVFDSSSMLAIYQSIVQHLHSLHLEGEDSYVIHADRITDYSFVSPLFRSYSHMLATKPALSATYNQSFEYFDVSAFADDLELTNYGLGFTNYNGGRIQSKLLIDRITLGFSLVDGLSKSGDGLKINLYNSFDIRAKIVDNIDAFGFIASNFMDLTQLSFGLGADVTLGKFDFTAAINYHNSCYNANLINDTPVHFLNRNGRVLEFDGTLDIDFDLLKVRGSINLPFEIGDSFKLFRRTASLRHSLENGIFATVSADYFEACAIIDLGWGHIIGGVNTVGLMGQISDSFSGIFGGSMSFGEVIKCLFSPDLGTLYVQADAKMDIADAFTRLELSKSAEGKYGVCCSVGMNLALD